ncbi:hypothetical protein JTB14_029254 [Gonioctena quinquepunctata]|nr:hypothetical protein JTB14_029254 [Gonioctena quinquepunctata]
MNEWFKISLLLCVFGFLKEIRPSEPFVFEFLIDKRWRNITEIEVTHKVYPVATYSYLIQSVVIFLITDLCRYKPLIILLGLSGVVIWSLLLWTKTLFELQVVEVIYGTFSAAEVAYYTYIYAKVDTEWYQQVTSHTRAAILAGRAISGISAQLLISYGLMNYRELNYITLSATASSTADSVKRKLMDINNYTTEKEDGNKKKNLSPGEKRKIKPSFTAAEIEIRKQKRHEEKMKLKKEIFEWFKENNKKNKD